LSATSLRLALIRGAELEKRVYLALAGGMVLLLTVAGATLWLLSLLRAEYEARVSITVAFQQTRALRAGALGLISPLGKGHTAVRLEDTAPGELIKQGETIVNSLQKSQLLSISAKRLAAAVALLEEAFARPGEVAAAVRLVDLRAGELEDFLMQALSNHQELEQQSQSLAWLIIWITMFCILLIAWSAQHIRDARDRERVAEQNRLLASRALINQERVYQTVVNNAHDAFISIDADGKVIDWNRQAEVIFGWCRQEALGLSLGGMIIPATHRDAHAAGMKRYLETGEGPVIGKMVEIEAVRRDGVLIPVELTISPLVVDGTTRFSAFLRDISARKQVERMKNEFISVVSHELRTPLTAISGSLQLVVADVAGQLPEEARELVRIANENSARLVRLVSDMLDIERIESGVLQFEPVPLDVREVVDQAITENHAYAHRFGVDVVMEASGSPVILFDRDRLLQVMSNLLSNASKFSPRGETVCVRILTRDSTVRIEVIDHGVGVPAEFYDRIFGRFAQADSSDARQKEGTGLGLSICRAILNRAGGQIGFESTPGHGAVFWICVDRLVCDPAVRQQAGVS